MSIPSCYASPLLTSPAPARPSRRPQHACGCHGHLRLLLHLDTLHGLAAPLPFPDRPRTMLTLFLPPALCRRGPPAALALPAPRLGHPHPRHPHRPLFHRRRLLPVRRHDTEQSQKGPQGSAEEGFVDNKPLLSMSRPSPTGPPQLHTVLNLSCTLYTQPLPIYLSFFLLLAAVWPSLV